MNAIRAGAAVFLCVLMLCCTSSLAAQDQSGARDSRERDSAGGGTGTGAAGADTAPEPYRDEEFPQWLHDLRRAEVILVGAFPLAMLVSTLSYDAYRGARNLVVNGTLVAEAGAEFGSFSADERKGLLIAGAGLSVSVALVDFLIAQMRNSAGRR